MTTQGRLDQRFFWERIGDDCLIFDRQRGAGCFGENFIARAVDAPTAEMLCGLMNLAEQFDKPARRVHAMPTGAQA